MTAGRPAENADHAGFDPELRIDWFEPRHLRDALPGRLGLTILPGKQGVSIRYPGRVYRRDLVEDIAALHRAGVRRLILLVEDAELRRWGDPEIVARGADGAVEVLRYPIPDGHAPASIAEIEAILADIGTGRRVGDVAVACMGGVGRSGTVAACLLVTSGMSPGDAIATVRAVRHPTAVETAEQERFVRSFANQLVERG